jgi:chemotaxis protein MotB
MASKGGNNAFPIIIKKVKKGGHGGHHGGAWKVAYADFVTAMMAFFLLLWLLNVTTDIQKRGIADYFEPTISSKSMSGAGGVLGGLTVGSPGSQEVPLSKPSFTLDRPGLRQPNEGDDGEEGGGAGKNHDDPDSDSNPATAQGDTGAKAKPLSDAELEKKLEAREEKRFEAAEKALRDAVEKVPDLKDLAQNLMIDRTPEGLRIQIVDQAKQPMFPTGSADISDPARKLISLVTQVVQRLPNKISITGHTDSTPYGGWKTYSNWELSADRANASRREFISDGLPPDRIARIMGMADRDPIIANDPAAPANRRISIVLLREAKEEAQAAEAAAAAAAPTPVPTPVSAPLPAPSKPH